MGLGQPNRPTQRTGGVPATEHAAAGALRPWAGRAAPHAVTLTDALGFIAGFAGAAFVYRETVLVGHRKEDAGLMAVAALAFVWLGVVLSGPVVLGLRRLQPRRALRLSAGEGVWATLGSLWIVAALARGLRPVDPIALVNLSAQLAALAAALAPLLLVLFWHAERRRPRPRGPQSWCDHVGTCCAASWPLGWMLAAFLLGL